MGATVILEMAIGQHDYVSRKVSGIVLMSPPIDLAIPVPSAAKWIIRGAAKVFPHHLTDMSPQMKDPKYDAKEPDPYCEPGLNLNTCFRLEFV